MKEMSVTEHLEELRTRVIRILGIVTIAFLLHPGLFQLEGKGYQFIALSGQGRTKYP